MGRISPDVGMDAWSLTVCFGANVCLLVLSTDMVFCCGRCMLRGFRLHRCPYWIRPHITVSDHNGMMHIQTALFVLVFVLLIQNHFPAMHLMIYQQQFFCSVLSPLLLNCFASLSTLTHILFWIYNLHEPFWSSKFPSKLKHRNRVDWPRLRFWRSRCIKPWS